MAACRKIAFRREALAAALALAKHASHRHILSTRGVSGDSWLISPREAHLKGP